MSTLAEVEGAAYLCLIWSVFIFCVQAIGVTRMLVCKNPQLTFEQCLQGGGG